MWWLRVWGLFQRLRRRRPGRRFPPWRDFWRRASGGARQPGRPSGLVGVDVAVVPAAADLVLREDPDRVVVAMPPRDVLGPVERAVARLARPAKVVGVPGSWDMPA